MTVSTERLTRDEVHQLDWIAAMQETTRSAVIAQLCRESIETAIKRSKAGEKFVHGQRPAFTAYDEYRADCWMRGKEPVC